MSSPEKEDFEPKASIFKEDEASSQHALVERTQSELDYLLKLFTDISNKLDKTANSLIAGDLIGVTQSFYSSLTLLKLDDYVFKPVPEKKLGRSKLERMITFANVELKFDIYCARKTFGVSLSVELDESYVDQNFKALKLDLITKHENDEIRFNLIKRIIDTFLESRSPIGLLDSLLHKVQDTIDDTDNQNGDDLFFDKKFDRMESVNQSSISDDLIQSLRAEAKDRKHGIHFDEFTNGVGQKAINLVELTQMNLLEPRELRKFLSQATYDYIDEHDRDHVLALANASQSFHLFEYNKMQLVMQQTNYDAYETKKNFDTITKQRFRLTTYKYWLTPLVDFFGRKSKVLLKQFILLESELQQTFTLMKKMKSLSRVINFKINLGDFDLDEERSHFVTLSFLKEAYAPVDSEVSISFANIQKMLKLMNIRQKMNIICKLATKVMTSIAYLHSKRIFFGNMLPTQFYFTFNGKYKIYDSFVDTFAYNLIFFILEKFVRTHKDGTKSIDDPDYLQVMRPDSAIVKSFIETDVYNIGLFIFTLGAGLQLRTLNYSKIKASNNLFEDPIDKFLKENDYPREFCDIVLSCIERDPECRPTVKLLLKHQFILKFINDVEDKPKLTATSGNLGLQGNFKSLNICENRFVNEFKRIDTLGKGGFGRVYKVQNIFDQHMYAMKVIDLYEYDPMLIREARNMSRLSHDNVVRYYSSWVEKADEELGLDNLDTLEEESGNTTKHESKEEYIDDDDDSGSNNSGTTQENSDDSTQHNINDDLDIEFSFESETEEANSSDTDKASTEDSDDSGDWTNSSEKHSVGKNKSILIGHPKENPLETVFEEDSYVQFQSSGSKSISRSNAESDDDEVEDDDEEEGSKRKKPILRVFIQMELCQNTLRVFLNEKRYSDDIVQRYKVLHEICSGLVYLHDQGMIHRDLKPENIFFLNGQIKIGDFGLACADDDDSNEMGNEGTGNRSMGPMLINEKAKEELKSLKKAQGKQRTKSLGTYLYKAPELNSKSSANYDAKVDVFSLGVVYFEMMYPFETGTERYLVLEKLHDPEPVFPDDIHRFSEEGERKLVRLMIKHNPTIRPNSIDVMKAVEVLESELVFSNKFNMANMKDTDDGKAIEEVTSKPTSMKFAYLLQRMFKRSAGVTDLITFNYNLEHENMSEFLCKSMLLNNSTGIFRMLTHLYGGRDFAIPLLSLQNDIFEPEDNVNTVRMIDVNGHVVKLAYTHNIRQRLARFVSFNSNISFMVRASIDKTYSKVDERCHPKETTNASFDYIWAKEFSGHSVLLYADIISLNLELILSFMPRVTSNDRKRLTTGELNKIKNFVDEFPLEMYITNLDILFNICQLLSISEYGYFVLVTLMATHNETVCELINCKDLAQNVKMLNKRKSLHDAIKAEIYAISTTKEPFFTKENTIHQIDQIILKLFLVCSTKLDDLPTVIYQILSHCFDRMDLDKFITTKVLPSTQRLSKVLQLIESNACECAPSLKNVIVRHSLGMLSREASQYNNLVIITMTKDYLRPRNFSSLILSVCGRFDYILNFQCYILRKVKHELRKDEYQRRVPNTAFYANKNGLGVTFNLDKLGALAYYWQNTMLAEIKSFDPDRLQLDVIDESLLHSQVNTFFAYNCARTRFQSAEIILLSNRACLGPFEIIRQCRQNGLRVLAMPEMDNMARDLRIVYNHANLQELGAIVLVDANQVVRERENLIIHVIFNPSTLDKEGQVFDDKFMVDTQATDLVKALMDVAGPSRHETYTDIDKLIKGLVARLKFEQAKVPNVEAIEEMGADLGHPNYHHSGSPIAIPTMASSFGQSSASFSQTNIDITLVKGTTMPKDRKALQHSLSQFVQRKYRSIYVTGQSIRVFGLDVSAEVVRSLQNFIIELDLCGMREADTRATNDLIARRGRELESLYRAYAESICNFMTNFAKCLQSVYNENQDLMVIVLVGYSVPSGYVSEMVVKSCT